MIQNKKINTLEGNLNIEGKYEIISINTSDSVFNIWPNKPSFETSNGNITFTGGIPNGIEGNDLKVFTIYIKPTKIGKLNSKFDDVLAFLNDGYGTKEPVSGMNSEVIVTEKGTPLENTFLNRINEDKTPPKPFKIEFGKDLTTFDGKYFISFNTEDKESGINRYEVKENDNPAIRSGTTYILKDQSLTGRIEVKAIDNAGNERISTYNFREYSHWSWIIIILCLIGVAVLVYFTKKRHHQN